MFRANTLTGLVLAGALSTVLPTTSLAGGASNAANVEGQGANIVVPPPNLGGTQLDLTQAAGALAAALGLDPATVSAALGAVAAAFNSGGNVELALGGTDGTGGAIQDIFGNIGDIDLDAPPGQDPQAVFDALRAAILRFATLLGLTEASPSIQTLLQIAATVLNDI